MDTLLNWISFNLKVDLDKIKYGSSYGHCSVGFVFSCPKGSILVDEDELSSTFTRGVKKGYMTKEYSAFEKGLGGGVKPNRFHPFLRYFYNKGLNK